MKTVGEFERRCQSPIFSTAIPDCFVPGLLPAALEGSGVHPKSVK